MACFSIRRWIVVFSICFSIAFIFGCSNSHNDVEAGKDAFEGTWIVEEIEVDGQSLSNRIEMLDAYGSNMELEFSDDGDLLFSKNDSDQIIGTWAAVENNKAEIMVGGDLSMISIQDDKLVLEADGSRMVCRKN